MTETKSNDLCEIIAQAFEQMKERDSDFSPEKVNLAELSRITGLSRQRLRRLKRNGFRDVPVTRRRSNPSVLDGFTSILDNMLTKGVTNSTVCLKRLREHGFSGSQSSVKRYIASGVMTVSWAVVTTVCNLVIADVQFSCFISLRAAYITLPAI